MADPSVGPGEIWVDAMPEGIVSAPPAIAPAPPAADPAPPAVDPARPPGHMEPAAGSSRFERDESAPVVTAAVDPSPTGIRGDGTQTLVFRRPVPPAARARLRVFTPDGGERTLEVDGTSLTIGRAHDNVLVIDDARVSRHHGQVQARYGALVYTDLGSTNGTRVNGIRVDEIVLGAGDRLLVGDTVLVVETLPG